MRRSRLLSLVLCAALGSSLPLIDSGLNSEAQAQSRKEAKRTRVLDYKAYEREKNREVFGELANEKRQEAISQLKKILAEQPKLPPDTKAEMLMRLAELYFEQSKYEYNTEMSDFDKRYEEWFNLPEAQQKQTTEPKIVATRSRAFTKKSIENYRVILQNYPNYGKVDEALFFLAFMLNDVGEEKDALSMYNKLVKTYPKSDFVADAYNAIGEYYFNNNNAYKALQAYKRAAAYKESKIYTFALYKMGWCYYNVGEFGTAIDTMKELVAETDRRIAATGEQVGISLKEEALRDLVLFFSEEGDLQAAKEYFIRYGEKRYYRKMLGRLGKIYMEQGKNDLSVQTYRELIADNPYASDNPTHQHQIISAYWKRDRFDEANEEINKLVETYGRESRWAQENRDSKKTIKESERLIEKNLRNVAIDSHQQALKRRSAKLLLLAEENYGRYLEYFSKGYKSYSMRYWFAEVLYKLKKYEPATTQYELVVAADPKGKFLKDAAGNTIFAIEEYLKPIKGKLDAAAKRAVADLKRKSKGVAKYAELDLHAWESRLIKACDTYASALPEDEKTLRFLYKAALLLHDRNHFNDSNERFLQIIRDKPKGDMAQYGVHQILESYLQIENWEKLNAAAREFYNNPEVGRTRKFKGELRNIYQRATFKIAEGFAEKDQAPEAAKAFDGFFREFEDSDVRDIALFNAAFYFGKAKQRNKMLELRHEFIEKFPKPVGKDAAKAQLYQKSLALLGSHYQGIADYRQSGELYRRLFDSEQSFELEGFTTARDALYNSALFNEALGQTDAAIGDFNDYLEAWPDAKDSIDTRLRIAHILRTTGKRDEAMAAFKAMYSDKKVVTGDFDVAMESYVRYGRMLDDRKKQLAHYREGMKYFSSNLSKAGDNVKSAPLYAAEMRFELLNPEFLEFAALAIPADTKKASKLLKKKMGGLQKMEKKYVEVLELKQGQWGISALYRIGTLYGNLADTLRAAPCPKKLDEDQCSIYKFGLEDKAYPLVDKAVEAFIKARQKSYELGLYTDYTLSSLQELSRLRPEEYPPNAESVPEPDYTSNPYTTSDFSF